MVEDERYRINEILKIIPEDVESVLDIGSRGDMFKKTYDTKSVDALEDADVVQDLNFNQKLPFKSKEFDIVIVNQILEHLGYVEEIISEAKRVSKKYILLGLPNEVTVDNRIRVLLGSPQWKGYLPYFHKHYFTVKEIEKFRKRFFEDQQIVSKDYFFACSGGRFLPLKFRRFLASLIPSLFAKEVWYILKLKDRR